MLVGALKELQTMMGDWHDRCVLLRHVAEFIARPNFLASHPDMSRALLAEIEKEKLRSDIPSINFCKMARRSGNVWRVGIR